jgi:hypothetical protein
MRVLLLSAVLYLLGVALVLFYRPRLMFFADGTWKEFGTGSTDRTVFPFWLFCILWGVLSYLIVSLFVSEPGVAPVVAAAVATTTASPEDEVMPLPPKTRGRNHNALAKEAAEGNMKPGYYVLDPKGTRVAGVPKYIYVGPEPTEEVRSALSSDEEE